MSGHGKSLKIGSNNWKRISSNIISGISQSKIITKPYYSFDTNERNFKVFKLWSTFWISDFCYFTFEDDPNMRDI